VIANQELTFANHNRIFTTLEDLCEDVAELRGRSGLSRTRNITKKPAQASPETDR
jgi:hypothetical protein